jgi:hypothetical protein
VEPAGGHGLVRRRMSRPSDMAGAKGGPGMNEQRRQQITAMRAVYGRRRPERSGGCAMAEAVR